MGVKLDHTWYEGIQACKSRSQSKTSIGQQLNAAQQTGIDYSNGTEITTSKAVITVAKTSTPLPDTTVITSVNESITMLVHASMSSASTSMLMLTPFHTSTSTSITSQTCEQFLDLVVHISLLMIITI